MREDDYQALVDEVCALLGTPATLESRDFALIAFGAHEGDGEGAEPALDPVRRRSILGRRSSAEVRTWFESFGITRATGPVRIDPEPSAGVEHGRICLPVRHGGFVHGYIWLMDDGALDLGDPRLASAMAVASRIGALLAAEAHAEARTGELLRTLLAADDRGAGEEAAAELRERLGSAAAGPLAVVAVVPRRPGGENGGPGERDLGQSAGPGAGGAPAPVPPNVLARCVLTVPGAGRAPGPDGAPAVAALVRLRSAEAAESSRTAAAQLVRMHRSPAAAGVSAPRRGLSDAVAAWREALAAARAATAEPERLGPVADWAAIGPYRLLTALPPGACADPAAAALLRPVHAELARTAEEFLDHAGQAGRTAAALGIHRQTLYYRLSRIEALTGLDLDEGSARLLLHMALKAARL
ncbi:PucR family transcriptional regulator [Streptomyces marispadix]|uniref:Helix-turn-helix domain-containing protein n=1 Tax=Streptomyces marispadix TaxID=2922868 RepID=A0ABS9T2N4_9ACTN|nr:helix-turn-helix domain-containing protein [Streptomyces marispadix]MCH6162795.1 helix-turn-helix domain-containing protein [Streptomyces marispadix]